MQNIDIFETNSVTEIETQIDEFVAQDMLSKELAEIVNVRKIYEFFNTEIGHRMKKSKQIKREVKFFLNIPACDISPELSREETVILQGIIDCYFEENGKLILLDYKTGRITEKYKKQLEIYKKALEKITHKEVAECHLITL